MRRRQPGEEAVRVKRHRLVRPRIRDEHAEEIHAEHEVLEGLEDHSLRRAAGERARTRLDFGTARADPWLLARSTEGRLQVVGLVQLLMRIDIPIRAGARTEPHGLSAPVIKSARNRKPRRPSVLVAEDRLGRHAMDCRGNRPRQLAEARARILVPPPAHLRIRANRPRQLAAFPGPPLRLRETCETPVAEAAGQIVLRLQDRRPVAIGQVVVHPDGSGLPHRMQFSDAREVGDELRIARTRKAPRREPVRRHHRPPVLSRTVARLEYAIRMPDDRLDLDGRHDADLAQVGRRNGTLPRMLLVPRERRKADARREPHLVERRTVFLERRPHLSPPVRLRVAEPEPQRAERSVIRRSLCRKDEKR